MNTVKELSNAMLMFHYIKNKEEINRLYIQQKEIEEEMKSRAKTMMDRASQGKEYDKED